MALDMILYGSVPFECWYFLLYSNGTEPLIHSKIPLYQYAFRRISVILCHRQTAKINAINDMTNRTTGGYSAL